MTRPEIKDLKQIGSWQELATYYLDEKTQTVWSYSHTTRGQLVNCGDYDQFKKRFSTMYRGNLY